jgi:replicative DNA helicase
MSETFEQGTPEFRKGRRRVEAAGDRLPPHSVEAEQGVLGCCLLSPNECLPAVLERLGVSGEAFYDLRHQTLARALADMTGASVPVDLISLQQWLKDRNELEGVGGLAYLSGLQDAVPSAANLPHYLDVVREKWTLRRVVRVCHETVAKVHEHAGEAMTVVNGFSAAAAEVTEQHSAVEVQPVHASFRAVIEELESFRQGRKQMKGFSTGLNYLDNMLCGLKAEEYIIIAARPGGGKTALALQMAEHVAMKCEAPVGIFSLEMGQQALASRMVFQKAGVNYQSYRNGFLRDKDGALLTQAMQQMKRMPVFVDESAGLSIEELAIRARRMVRQHGVKLFIIDYLQLLTGRSGKDYHDMNARVSDTSDGLMKLKKELKVPFIVLAQENANRERAERDRPPVLSDLKDSQKPAQDADCVMFLAEVDLTRARRDLASNDETKRAIAEAQLAWMDGAAVAGLPADIREDIEANVKRQNLYVCKQRNGPTGPVELLYVKPWMRFMDAHTKGGDEGAEVRFQ